MRGAGTCNAFVRCICSVAGFTSRGGFARQGGGGELVSELEEQVGLGYFGLPGFRGTGQTIIGAGELAVDGAGDVGVISEVHGEEEPAGSMDPGRGRSFAFDIPTIVNKLRR